jgi:pimeloyl-ACP methyl ester carboxylesterase
MPLDKKRAAKVGEFVQFAYNMFDEGDLQPKPDPGLAARGYQLLYWLNATDSLGPEFGHTKRFYGYLAAAINAPSKLVIAIRGTRGAQEWLLDFLAIPVPFTPAPEKGFVALGFSSIFDSFEFVSTDGTTTTLAGVIEHLNTIQPISTITVAGHSLGSALATLAAAELVFLDVAGAGSAVQLWTFASPAVGLLDFAGSFDAMIAKATRIWNILDIVAYVPPPPFIHVSGAGNVLIQSLSQLDQLQYSPHCEHILTDYLWLLDSATFAGDNLCVMPDRRPPLEAQQGLRAMHRAIAAQVSAGSVTIRIIDAPPKHMKKANPPPPAAKRKRTAEKPKTGAKRSIKRKG